MNTSYKSWHFEIVSMPSSKKKKNTVRKLDITLGSMCHIVNTCYVIKKLQ